MKKLLTKIQYNFYYPLAYGLSLIIPITPSKLFGLVDVIFGVSFVILITFPFIFIQNAVLPNIFFTIFIIVSVIRLFYILKNEDKGWIFSNYLIKERVLKYYRIDVSCEKNISDTKYRELLKLHRKFGRYNDKNKLIYIEDETLIKEFKKYNRKWISRAILYILINALFVYLMINQS